jgi:hypothetical protein
MLNPAASSSNVITQRDVQRSRAKKWQAAAFRFVKRSAR